MNRSHRLFAVIVSFIPALASAQSGLTYDFTLKESVQGREQSSVGHAWVSGNNVRMDIVGPSSFGQFGLMPLGGTVSVISADTGEAQLLSLIGQTEKQYLQFAPVAMMKKMKDAMALVGCGPQLDFTGSKATVDSLGPGGTIAGYATLHYRVTIAVRLGMSGQQMGKQDVVNEYYIAPDLKDFARGSSMLSGTDEVSSIPGIQKAFSDDLIAAGKRVGFAMALRVETTASGEMMGIQMSKKQTLEVTGVKRADIPASTFIVPAGYKRIVPPGMETMM